MKLEFHRGASGGLSRLLTGFFVCLAGLAMVFSTLYWEYRVYEPEAHRIGPAAFFRISQVALVVDSTFSGITRAATDGRLVSTYDRSQPQGRRACPT